LLGCLAACVTLVDRTEQSAMYSKFSVECMMVSACQEQYAFLARLWQQDRLVKYDHVDKDDLDAFQLLQSLAGQDEVKPMNHEPLDSCTLHLLSHRRCRNLAA
jgi:hypothetical protein